MIRLLGNDSHLLGQHPLHHGQLIGDRVTPNLL